jgi:hypothetical protein
VRKLHVSQTWPAAQHPVTSLMVLQVDLGVQQKSVSKRGGTKHIVAFTQLRSSHLQLIQRES